MTSLTKMERKSEVLSVIAPKLEPILETNIQNEFGRLKSAIVNRGSSVNDQTRRIFSETITMDVLGEKKVLNDEQKEFIKQDNLRIIKQVGTFIDLLRDNGVNLIFAEDVKDAFGQFFTRDVGFVVGRAFCIASRKSEIRQTELSGLIKILPHIQKAFIINKGVIEGGDVLINGSDVYVGLSKKTNEKGLQSFKIIAEGEGFEVILILLKKSVLHLDCAFNMLSDKLAIVHPWAIEKGLMQLESDFELISVTSHEAVRLATNLLVLDKGVIVSDNQNIRVNSLLRDRGFKVHELPYDAVIRSGGSFRCTVLPLLRE